MPGSQFSPVCFWTRCRTLSSFCTMPAWMLPCSSYLDDNGLNLWTCGVIYSKEKFCDNELKPRSRVLCENESCPTQMTGIRSRLPLWTTPPEPHGCSRMQKMMENQVPWFTVPPQMDLVRRQKSVLLQTWTWTMTPSAVNAEIYETTNLEYPLWRNPCAKLESSMQAKALFLRALPVLLLMHTECD